MRDYDDDYPDDDDDDDEETANRRLFGPLGPDGRSEITEPTERDVIRELHSRGIYVPYEPQSESFLKRLLSSLVYDRIPCNDRGRPVKPGKSVSMATRTFHPSAAATAAKQSRARQEAAADELIRLATGQDADYR